MAKPFLHFIKLRIGHKVTDGTKIPAGTKVLLAITTGGAVIRFNGEFHAATNQDLLMLINRGDPRKTDWLDKAHAALDAAGYTLKPMSRKAKYVGPHTARIKVKGKFKDVTTYVCREPADEKGMGTLYKTLSGDTYFLPSYPKY